MKSYVLHLLVHLVSVIVAMPYGWCCWLPTVAAQEPSAEVSACCCCPEPAKPAHAPRQTPTEGEETPQAPSCCCEPQAFAIVEAKGAAIEPRAVLAQLPHTLLPGVADATDNAAPVSLPFLPPAEPSLHILHCIWLC